MMKTYLLEKSRVVFQVRKISRQLVFLNSWISMEIDFEFVFSLK